MFWIRLPVSNVLNFSWLSEMYELATVCLQLCDYLCIKLNYRVYSLWTAGPTEWFNTNIKQKNTLPYSPFFFFNPAYLITIQPKHFSSNQ